MYTSQKGKVEILDFLSVFELGQLETDWPHTSLGDFPISIA